MDEDGTYYFIISFVDGAGNVSAPFVFEYILERNYFKKIQAIHFYKDQGMAKSLGMYNFQHEEGYGFVDFDDILTCKTRLNN